MIKEFVLDLFFPNKCPCCDSYIKWNELVCTKCNAEMELITDKLCGRCGKYECICNKNLYYDKAFVCYEYSDFARSGILSLKDSNNINFGKHIGNLLGKILKSNIDCSKVDWIIPVPSSKDRIKKRGYNQTNIIAEAISIQTGIKINKRILIKNKSEYQHKLKAAEREKNTSSISINNIDLKDKVLIICDDVLTTGNTINKCSELLKDNGAVYVYAAVGTTTKLEKRKDK